MKKILQIIILISFNLVQSQIVNIPDNNFKNALLSSTTTNDIARDLNGQRIAIDSNNDGDIQISEAENILELRIDHKNIANLVGIQEFINLSQLDCNYNQITDLNFSNNTNLVALSCTNNQIETLELSNNINLGYLYCSQNQLTTLELNNNVNLNLVSCNSNQITTLDMNNNINLLYLYCANNQIESLNLSNNTSLSTLDCQSNQMSTLILNNTNLISLNCGTNLLNNLDLNNNNLTTLYCNHNQLTTLNIENSISITRLTCDYNELTLLDLSNNIYLERVYCSDNLLTTLDLSNNYYLTRLSCRSNTNLEYINLKNGNNDNFNTWWGSSFLNLPNLQDVCVDELDTSLTTYISDETGHSVNFTTDCSTLFILDKIVLDFTIFPNPSEYILNIKSKTDILKIEIYSKLGQLIIKNTTDNKIDISNLPQGIYFVKVKDINGNFGMKKIMKK